MLNEVLNLNNVKIYLIVIEDKVVLCLCYVSKIIVCKDDDFSALTDHKFINENIKYVP